MFQVPWGDYSEEEILELVSIMFKKKGFSVYNIHKLDRRMEDGIDIECKKSPEEARTIIAVKKKPEKKDVGQLIQFAEQDGERRVYIHVLPPTADFKKKMEEMTSQVVFWNAKKLTEELFSVSPELYMTLMIENYALAELFEINAILVSGYRKAKVSRVSGNRVKPSPELIQTLWHAKDRTVSLYKSFFALQVLFESMDLGRLDTTKKKAIAHAYLYTLQYLYTTSLAPLGDLFRKILRDYPEIFNRFVKQSQDSSHWITLAGLRLYFLPGRVLNTVEEMKKEDDDDIESALPPAVADMFGNTSRMLAIEGECLETVVDGLLGIVLYDDWWKAYISGSDQEFFNPFIPLD
jgi:hypothetical protein